MDVVEFHLLVKVQWGVSLILLFGKTLKFLLMITRLFV